MMDHFYWLQPLANIKPNNIYIYIYIYIISKNKIALCIHYTPPIHHNPNHQHCKEHMSNTTFKNTKQNKMLKFSRVLHSLINHKQNWATHLQ